MSFFYRSLTKSSLDAYMTYKQSQTEVIDGLIEGSQFKVHNEHPHVIFISSKVPCCYVMLTVYLNLNG